MERLFHIIIQSEGGQTVFRESRELSERFLTNLRLSLKTEGGHTTLIVDPETQTAGELIGWEDPTPQDSKREVILPD